MTLRCHLHHPHPTYPDNNCFPLHSILSAMSDRRCCLRMSHGVVAAATHNTHLLQAVQGYDHFRAPEGSTNPLCVLFDQAEIDRWHAMLFANERAAQVDVLHAGVIRARNNAGAAARLCRCPVCGQENLREGRNNLLRCWSCTSHFCYACRTWLRSKVGQHFVGAGACKQHGD